MLCWRLHVLPQPAFLPCLALSPLVPLCSQRLRSLTSGVGLRVLTLLSGPVPSLHRVCQLLLLLRGLPILVLPAVSVWLMPSGSVTLRTPLRRALVLGVVSRCALALRALTPHTSCFALLLGIALHCCFALCRALCPCICLTLGLASCLALLLVLVLPRQPRLHSVLAFAACMSCDCDCDCFHPCFVMRASALCLAS